MPISAAAKSATRRRIVRTAGRAFRRDGYAAARLGDVMAEAGLTHGAFYAHFPSKAALFAEVAREDHDLLARLKAAEGLAARAAVPDAWLDPSTSQETLEGCTLSALGAKAARQDGAAAQGVAQAFEDVVASLQGAGARPDAATLVIGAVGAARILPEAARRETLKAARAETARLLQPRRKGRRNPWGFGD